MGHPVLGDPVYGRNKALRQSAKSKPELLRIVSAVQRQMLHAARLSLRHPISGEQLTFEAPMPRDMTALVEEFRTLSKGANH
jgi:23S rRNA pseudouridine1911/1915/1917 synthase